MNFTPSPAVANVLLRKQKKQDLVAETQINLSVTGLSFAAASDLRICVTDKKDRSAQAKKDSQLEAEFSSRKFPCLKSRLDIQWLMSSTQFPIEFELVPLPLEANLRVDPGGGRATKGCPSRSCPGGNVAGSHLPCGGFL